MGDGQTRTKLYNASALDPATGEYRDLIVEIPERTGAPQPKAKEVFLMTYTAALAELPKLKLTGRERDVLDTLVVDMAYNEPFKVSSPAVIAKRIGTSRDVVYGALARLREVGILIDVDAERSLLSPRLYWRGSEEKRREWIIMLEHGGAS